MGLLIDHFGLFESTVTTLSRHGVIGAVLCYSVSSGTARRSVTISHDGGNNRWHHQKTRLLVWRLLGILTGMMSAAQTAINGHLGSVLGSAVKGP